jgi:hypothetical protein
VSFAVPSALGGNIDRIKYAALPVAALAAALVHWRPVWIVAPLVAVAVLWNVPPLVANYRHAASDPADTAAYWQPAVRFLHAHSTPAYRVEVVDTVEHWPAVFFPDAGIPIVRGWYRQNDFPANAILYGRYGPAAYRRWLRTLGVRYVVLSSAPPDYSSRAEATLLRSGRSGLRPVLRTPRLNVFELPNPASLASDGAVVEWLGASRARLRVPVRGSYRVAIRFSPYWRTFQGCVEPTADGMTRVYAFREGIVDLDFKVNVHRGFETLTGLTPTRFCRG